MVNPRIASLISVEMSGEELPIVDGLIRAAAEEVQAWYQYLAPAKFLKGPERVSIVEAFLEVAEDELDDHFDSLMQRLSEKGVAPTQLMTLRSMLDFHDVEIPIGEPFPVAQAITNAIKSEEDAIATYMNLIAISEHSDVLTYDLAKRILADEQEHLQRFKDFQDDFQLL